MKNQIEVENVASFEFWVNMFRPRTHKYLKDALRSLKKSVSIFETLEENQTKIKAINFILGK